MKTEQTTEGFVIAFPGDRNNTRYYVKGRFSGVDNPVGADSFSTIEAAQNEIEKVKSELEEWKRDDCKMWIENMEGEIQ